MLLRGVAVVLLLGGLSSAVSGPNDRQPTDPKSVTSISNPNAKPVAVEDLYAVPYPSLASLPRD